MYRTVCIVTVQSRRYIYASVRFLVQATPGSSVVKDIKSDQELRKPHEKMVALKPSTLLCIAALMLG